ncbi:MAG: hypothetical protein V2I33_19775 [Kangiellaceae bacterium]|jgi:hypothetical protein|nr:hypothetical protein [Kangiellaceae bacterium]
MSFVSKIKMSALTVSYNGEIRRFENENMPDTLIELRATIRECFDIANPLVFHENKRGFSFAVFNQIRYACLLRCCKREGVETLSLRITSKEEYLGASCPKYESERIALEIQERIRGLSNAGNHANSTNVSSPSEASRHVDINRQVGTHQRSWMLDEEEEEDYEQISA